MPNNDASPKVLCLIVDETIKWQRYARKQSHLQTAKGKKIEGFTDQRWGLGKALPIDPALRM
jgi:hypothetical protein